MLTSTFFKLVVFASVLVAPWMIYIATQTETNTQDVHTWLPSGTPERAKYDHFLELFGHDDDILISWDDCKLDDPRLALLTERLELHAQADGIFRGVVNGRDLLKRLTDSSLGLKQSSAVRRLKNVFLGPDGETSGIVIQLSDTGRKDRKACVRVLMAEVDATPGLTQDNVRVGGSSYISSQIDKATNHALMLSLPAIFLAVMVSFICLRSWRLTFITLWTAGFASLSSVALVTAMGFKINGLLVLMPVLVLVLALSSCVHLSSYYKSVLRQQPYLTPLRVAMETLSYGWRPSSMAMLTTSVGILMLSMSHIEAVRHFGAFSAVAVALSLVSVMSIYPALLYFLPASDSEKKAILEFAPSIPTVSQSHALPWRAIATVVMVFMFTSGVFCFFHLDNIKTTLCPTKMFSCNSEVNRNYTWISQNWSSLESIEVLVDFPEDQGMMIEQLRTVSQIHSATTQVPGVCSAFSVANLSPKISWRKNMRASAERRALDAKLNEHQSTLIDRKLIALADERRVWRLRLGVCIENDRDYEQLLAGINSQVDMACASIADKPKIITTGIWPLSAAGRHQLFNDLAYSFLMAFAIITPVVMLILGGFLVGLVAMIPNVFPALIFFGLLGYLGWSVDIGMILTASVGMGIAVDDTLHFVEWYAREREKASPLLAVKRTIKQCARPMLYTTLICSSGLIVFAFSEFVPPQQFAYAIVALLCLALVCDLILLPALIVGPLQFVFESTRRAKEEPAQILTLPEREATETKPTKSRRRAA